MLQIKVPFLKPGDLDHAAAELLRQYGAWKKAVVQPPIDVDEIAEGYLQLTLEVADLKERLGMDDVLGATWFDEGCVRIDRSLEGKEGRFAFTVAHEIGHWQLHRPLYEMDKVTLPLFSLGQDQEPTPAVVCRAKERKTPAEWQADQFAARLLMPTAAVRATTLRICNAKPPVWDGPADSRKTGVPDARLRAFAGDVIAEGGFLNVSNEAMCYRLLDLKLVKDKSQATAELF
jgi:Zn-dependent peptidase ImmA (M78 family)